MFPTNHRVAPRRKREDDDDDDDERYANMPCGATVTDPVARPLGGISGHLSTAAHHMIRMLWNHDDLARIVLS